MEPLLGESRFILTDSTLLVCGLALWPFEYSSTARLATGAGGY